MSNNMNDENVPPDNDEYYEIVASQEELYLEENEEEVREILISVEGVVSRSDSSTLVKEEFEREKRLQSDPDDPCTAENLEQQMDHASEDLITGDSDDPPLSEEEVVDMVDKNSKARKLGSNSFLSTFNLQRGDL